MSITAGFVILGFYISYRNSSRTSFLDTLLPISSTKLLFNFISWSFWLIGGLQKEIFIYKKPENVNYLSFKLYLSKFLIDHWMINYLYIFLDSNQTLFKSVKGGGVKHFLLDFGSVWAPAHQKQFFFLGLFGGTFTLMWVFEIK